MDKLPPELIEDIIVATICLCTKNEALAMRLVCREFDLVLKPYVCDTIGLEHSKFSKSSGKPKPVARALKTIGNLCHSICIDLMVLRDQGRMKYNLPKTERKSANADVLAAEVDFLRSIANLPSMKPFCDMLVARYCMNDKFFTEQDYLDQLVTILDNCRRVSRLRLNLPIQVVRTSSSSTTMILANTLKAFATRPTDEIEERDSWSMDIVVIENLTDLALCDLWANPIDIGNIRTVFHSVQALNLNLRRYVTREDGSRRFHAALWGTIQQAKNLQTLCISEVVDERAEHRSVKVSKLWHMDVQEFDARRLRIPIRLEFPLVRLELCHVELNPAFFVSLCANFKDTLEELYLNDVSLQIHQTTATEPCLWVGVPNAIPEEPSSFIAPYIRSKLERLRVCRAAFLGYHVFISDEQEPMNDFDFYDPSGMARTISQRFVEVVAGIRQPINRHREPVVYLSCGEDTQLPLAERTRLHPEDYDVNAYQLAVENSTSSWRQRLDGIYPNVNHDAMKELHSLAERTDKELDEGSRELHRRAGILDEDADNQIAGWDDDDSPASWGMTLPQVLMQEVALGLRDEAAAWSAMDGDASGDDDGDGPGHDGAGEEGNIGWPA